jgi:hypothetical protein
MKPLKRPMFRSGGPIKEGIMDGMQDRPGYLIGGLIPLGAAAMRILPAAVRGFKAVRTYKPLSEKLGTFGRLKDIFSPKPGVGLQSGKAGPQTLAGEGLGFRIGSFARQNPITALSTPSLATSAVTGVGPVALEAAKTGGKALANFLVPGERFDPFKEGGDKKTTETDTTGLKKVDSFDETEPKSKAVPQETKDQLTADRIEENRKRYYKLMGIDKMKKGAAYDSLIDASRIIQEQGSDLKGALKSGTLQSAIINAISKNLDKSTDLKKQIDAAILKGEIEKDIKSADTMDKRLKEAQIKRLERDERQNTTAAKIAAVQVDKGAVTGADTAAILRADGIDYTGILPDDEFLKFKKKNKGKDERDFLIENYGALDDGKYIVGGRLVEKRGNNVAFAV